MATRTYTGIFLKFQTPVHLGEFTGEGMESVHAGLARSETLWAALLTAWVRLAGTSEPLAPPRAQDLDTWHPPFRLSSAFPFVDHTLYFPLPFARLPGEDRERRQDPALRKLLKKVRFIPKPLFERWLQGQPFEPAHFDALEQGWQHLQSHLQEYQEPHVALGHAAFQSQIYYVGVATFHPRAGLFFLVEPSQQDLEPLRAALNLLAEEGLGGRRSQGLGRFTWHEAQVQLQVPEAADAFVLLSSLNPCPEFLQSPEVLQKSSYALYESKGWALSPVTKHQAFRKPVWMFGEGSVFPREPRGRLLDVTPYDWQAPHPVYRHGIAFAVPLKSEEDHA